MLVAIAVAACGGGGGTPDEGSTTAAGSSSGAATTTGSASADASASAGSDDEGLEEAEGAEETDGPGSPCLGDVELAEVAIELTVNRVFGEDVDAPFDPDQGSHACVGVSDEVVRIYARFGPFDFGEPGSYLGLDVYDGARVYDLATDPAPPGSGEPGLVRFQYDYQIESATTASFGTINQASTGTVDVVALPIDGGAQVEFTAAGEIAAPDGWEFDMHFTAVVPVQ
jgi:hypothetical protein